MCGSNFFIFVCDYTDTAIPQITHRQTVTISKIITKFSLSNKLSNAFKVYALRKLMLRWRLKQYEVNTHIIYNSDSQPFL